MAGEGWGVREDLDLPATYELTVQGSLELKEDRWRSERVKFGTSDRDIASSYFMICEGLILVCIPTADEIPGVAEGLMQKALFGEFH